MGASRERGGERRLGKKYKRKKGKKEEEAGSDYKFFIFCYYY